MLNYFNFKRFGKEFLITNDFGCHQFLTENEFQEFITNNFSNNEKLCEKLRNNLFIIEPSEILSEKLQNSLRKIKSYLFTSTALHIFVLTNACNMQCIYCQAESKLNKTGMMTKDMAEKAVNIALSSPSRVLSFEFQGGEPLISFESLKHIVEYTNEKKNEKEISFNLVSNLSLLTDEMIEFFVKNNISICTSLDGPKELQNTNRPKCGSDSFKIVENGIGRLKEAGISVGAIQTTTKYSLEKPIEIIHSYVALGLHSIFLRPLTPLGTAKKRWKEIGYSAADFLIFYKRAFMEIMKVNLSGYKLKENHAEILLKKILISNAYNYMELRSPCGASLGQIAYNYDGEIYTCDEGRMIGESGDDIFCLGNVFDSDYQSIVSSSTCKATCSASVLESIPSCCDCVYQPYCGVCPVVNYALYGDIIKKESNDYRCMIYSGILDFLFEILHSDNIEMIKILYSWVGEEYGTTKF